MIFFERGYKVILAPKATPAQEGKIIFGGGKTDIMEISVVPVGTGNASVSPLVAAAIKLLQQEPAVKYQFTAMGTIMEGESEKLFELAHRLYTATLAGGAPRLVTTI
ncbi:MTH1187 family thiamine-binding protein [Chloroflexota bacterium]